VESGEGTRRCRKKNQFWLGFCPRPQWGAYSAPQTHNWNKGDILLMEWEGCRERKGDRKRRGDAVYISLKYSHISLSPTF